jgi:hypothetical protein
VSEAAILRRVIQDCAASAIRALEAFHDGEYDLGLDMLNDLAADLSRAANSGREHSCPYCESSYPHAEPLQRHIERMHLEDIDDAGGAPARGGTPRIHLPPRLDADDQSAGRSTT